MGPPVTGKTLLAKAVAGEAKVPFFSLSGSVLWEMFVGGHPVSAICLSRLEVCPALSLSTRWTPLERAVIPVWEETMREQTLNQLLSEMDGFDSSKGLLVMAATNRPEILIVLRRPVVLTAG